MGSTRREQDSSDICWPRSRAAFQAIRYVIVYHYKYRRRLPLAYHTACFIHHGSHLRFILTSTSCLLVNGNTPKRTWHVVPWLDEFTIGVVHSLGRTCWTSDKWKIVQTNLDCYATCPVCGLRSRHANLVCKRSACHICDHRFLS